MPLSITVTADNASGISTAVVYSADLSLAADQKGSSHPKVIALPGIGASGFGGILQLGQWGSSGAVK